VKLVAALLRDAGVTAGLAESNGSLLPDYDSHHLQADCQEPGSASEPYTRQSSMGYLYRFYHHISRKGHDIVGPVVRPPVYTLAEKTNLTPDLDISHMHGHNHSLLGT